VNEGIKDRVEGWRSEREQREGVREKEEDETAQDQKSVSLTDFQVLQSCAFRATIVDSHVSTDIRQ
jgi:hypothetical protein